jgi:hypothetical protein
MAILKGRPGANRNPDSVRPADAKANRRAGASPEYPTIR